MFAPFALYRRRCHGTGPVVPRRSRATRASFVSAVLLIPYSCLLDGTRVRARRSTHIFAEGSRRNGPGSGRTRPSHFLKENVTVTPNYPQDQTPSRRHRRLHLFNPLKRRRNVRSSQPLTQLRSRKGQMYFTCSAIVFVWISLGTLFYSHYYQWPLPQSFFYAVDAGMSIGFCTDVAETRVGSRAFTIVHILLGASCVGGALVLMVQSALDGVASRSAAVYKLMLERDSLKKAFQGMNSSPAAFLRNGWVSPNKRGILSYEQFREVLNDNGLRISDKEFARVCKFYDPLPEGLIRYDYFAKNFQGMHMLIPMTRFINYKSFPMDAFARAWSAMSSLFTNESHRIYLIFVLWIGMGILWGMIDQGWDFITATHFAVSALATGGLTAPPVDSDGILPAGAAWFCGFYCLLGIPLMALTLGTFARVLVEGYIVEEELATVTRPLSISEYRFASKSLCSTDAAIHLSDYIVLQLMRQGKLSLELFEFMKRQYQVQDQRRIWLNRVDPD